MLLAGVALTVSLQIGITVSVDSLMDDFIKTNRNHNFTDITIYGEDNLTVTDINDLIPSIQEFTQVSHVSPAVGINLSTVITLPQNLPNTYIYRITSEHPDYVEEVQAHQESIKESVSLEAVEKLVKQIVELTQNLDISSTENKKWHDLYETQGEKFTSGKIDDQVFAVFLRRYLKYLEKTKIK